MKRAQAQTMQSLDEVEPTRRISIPTLESLLGKKLKVLDDGFVKLIDYMGGDQSVVRAARISYGKGTQSFRADRGLIRYLMRHRHTTPFEMCEITLHIRAPMDVWRQWIRHRTANVNEYSTRYSVAIDAAAKTKPNAWRAQSKRNKQGSGGSLPASVGKILSREEAELHQYARTVYEERLRLGVAREQARKDLPLSTYTEAYWKIDLWNLLHFLGLRMDQHAQEEIRFYAHEIGNSIVSQWVPLTWEAFQDYQLNGLSLSSVEGGLLSAILQRDQSSARSVAEECGWLNTDPATGELLPNGEREEFVQKAAAFLGLDVAFLRQQTTEFPQASSQKTPLPKSRTSRR